MFSKRPQVVSPSQPVEAGRDIGRTEHSLWNEWSMGPTVGEFHPVQGVASNDGEPLCESNATLT